jgi:hypothetical protein
MKRFTSTELGALALAVVFFVAGFVWLIWPRETVVVHPTNNEVGWPGSSIEVVSKTGSRIYGVIAIALGAGIGALVLYRPKISVV